IQDKMAKIYFGEANLIKNKIVIPIYVDTEGESVNAYEVKIKFSDNLIFRDFYEAGSIINFWVEKPIITQIITDENNVRISSRESSQGFATSYNFLQFSGVSIGGYVGRKGLLTNLIFEAKGENALIEILPSSKVLLNDGFGTEAKLKGESKFLEIKKLTQDVRISSRESSQEFATKQEFIEDKFPPESFQIYLYKNKEIFEGKYFIIFNTTDKQSGIAYYEVAEKQGFIKPNLKDLNFEKAESPYILKDQTLRSYIFVKAVDKVGNERIEYLKPKKLLSFDEIFNILIFGIIIFFLIKLIYKKWRLKIWAK
ncbi:MAG: hypothetical protein QXG91_03570, partial [Candidatus Aenigmatarchaeota archaeon]